MNVHVLQHVPFEGLGSIETWLSGRHANLGYTRFYELTRLPELDGLDLVIALGGPMSVNDEEQFPWLQAEKQFLRAAIECGTAVVGICLGAQLIASALGARVYPNPVKEIGWLEIVATPAVGELFRFPEQATVFHWHGETFDLPAGATRLAQSATCVNQAFQIGRNVLGLQFHLETTPASVTAMLADDCDELVPGPAIQSEAEIRAAGPLYYSRINQLMEQVLNYATRTRA